MISNIGLADLLLISPVLVLFLFSLLPLITKVTNGNTEQNPKTTLITALMGLGISAGLLILFFQGAVQKVFGSLFYFVICLIFSILAI